MQVVSIEPRPFHSIEYRLGSGDCPWIAVLPFFRAMTVGLPHSLDAIIATCKDRTAVLLAGDLHPSADEGDVLPVWYAMGNVSRWVAGVAGNHDAFGEGASARDARRALDHLGLHFLDGDSCVLDGLRIGGISGIIGNVAGPWTRCETDFVERICGLANEGLDLLVLHAGPNIFGTDLTGWPSIRQILENANRTLVIRGHDPWETQLVSLINGTQVLNVEGRMVILTRGDGDARAQA